MSKGIMNRRDKMIWDNSALPTIDDVTGQITDLAESVAEDLQDAYEELDDKIDQAVTDCTYTAGTGISIDEDNVISATGGANYSTTERVVGRWIDGKPLYQITVEDTLSVSSSIRTLLTLDLTNKKIKNTISCTARVSDTFVLNNGYNDGGSWKFVAYFDGGNLYGTASWGDSPLTVSVTFQYTKTTD